MKICDYCGNPATDVDAIESLDFRFGNIAIAEWDMHGECKQKLVERVVRIVDEEFGKE